jgi:chemotaxis signal transduction protein
MAESPQDAKTTSTGELQLVVFAIGCEEFGVEIMNVQEIILNSQEIRHYN